MNYDSSTILQNLPDHPIFEALLSSSPYLSDKTIESQLLNVFNEISPPIPFQYLKEEFLTNLVGFESS